MRALRTAVVFSKGKESRAKGRTMMMMMMMMMMMTMMIGTMIPAGVRIIEELWFNFHEIKDFCLKK